MGDQIGNLPQVLGSPLIVVLVCGLLLNNTHLLRSAGRLGSICKPGYEDTLAEFKGLVAEYTPDRVASVAVAAERAAERAAPRGLDRAERVVAVEQVMAVLQDSAYQGTTHRQERFAIFLQGEQHDTRHAPPHRESFLASLHIQL